MIENYKSSLKEALVLYLRVNWYHLIKLNRSMRALLIIQTCKWMLNILRINRLVKNEQISSIKNYNIKINWLLLKKKVKGWLFVIDLIKSFESIVEILKSILNSSTMEFNFLTMTNLVLISSKKKKLRLKSYKLTNFKIKELNIKRKTLNKLEVNL